MSEFRKKFSEAFGCDFPGHAVELAFPRLRFELAAGVGLKKRLETGERRAISLFHRVFAPDVTVGLEVTFWPESKGHSARKQLKTLSEEGLAPEATWEREVVAIDKEGDNVCEERYSTIVRSGSSDVAAVLRAVVWMDHGGWRGLSFRAMAFDAGSAVGFFPYDDRGLDVFAKRPESLIPIYDLMTDWILEYDRPRILSELGI